MGVEHRADLVSSYLPSVRPLLLAVDPDPVQLDVIEAQLQRAFGSDFRIRGEATAQEALRTVRGAYERGEPVAVVLVDDSCDADVRAGLFTEVRTLHPAARRALLVKWGAWSERTSAAAILHAMALATSTTTFSSHGRSGTSSSIGQSPSSCTSGRAVTPRTPARWSWWPMGDHHGPTRSAA